MANPEVVKFIREQSAAGYNDAEIRQALKSKGHADSDIDMAMAEASGQAAHVEDKKVGLFFAPSWEIYLKLFPRFMKMYGQILARALIAALPGLILFGVGWYMDKNNIGGDELSTRMHGALLGLQLIYVVVFVYFSIWAQIASILIIKDRNNPSFDPRLNLAQAKPLIRSYFWTEFLVGLFAGLLLLLFIVPGVIFYIYWSFSSYIVIDKRLSGMAAMRVSRSLVSGLWWPVFVSILAVIALIIIVTMILSQLEVIIGKDASDILSSLITFIITPYCSIYLYLLYEKLKSLKPEVS